MIKGLNINDYKYNCDISKREINDIAIIGMDIKIPGINNEYDFWNMLTSGKESICSLSDERINQVNEFCGNASPFKNTDIRPIGGFFEVIDEFDYEHFKILPREAELMNPMQRMLLISVRDLFENAGYTDKEIQGSNTGVYLGMISDTGINKYKDIVYKKSDKAYLQLGVVGNLSSITTGRISYFWNLSGPSILIDTACSSSLVALHTACNALRNAECKMAIVSGINLDILPGVNDVKVGFESKSNKTRPFSDNADGTAFGEGVISLLIKPLENAINDKDNVYAVIKGSAVNQDGYSMGITAPNPEAQKNVILKAWDNAGINPCEISYIETHGTGTILGDPIEVEGISSAFSQTQKEKQSCAIGSVKSNIGHLYGAAGLASVAKCALSLKKRMIPSSINFDVPNRKIDLQNGYVYVADHLTDWENEKLLCGVSSFGFSGTNCHMILEESQMKNDKSSEPMMFAVSDKSKDDLDNLVEKYKDFILNNKELNYQDVCYTACIGRNHKKYRMAAWVCGMDEIFEFLTVGSIEEMPEEEQLPEDMMKPILDSRESILYSYLRGADIPWKKLYKNIDVNKICIPVSSHDKRKCWIGNLDKKEKEKVAMQKDYDNKYSEIESEISRIVMNALGIETIDVYRELMDYGASSVLLAEVLAKIDEKYPKMLTLPQLFVYSNIEKISKYISEKDCENGLQVKIEIHNRIIDDEIDEIFKKLEDGSESIDEAVEEFMAYSI